MPRQHEQWRIGTINVRTAKEDEKLERIIYETNKAKLYVCGVQEVRRLNTGSTLISTETDLNQKYEFYWSGHSLKRIHGVGIAIKVDKNIVVEEVKYVSARLIIADVTIYGCSLRIINCYAPTEADSSNVKDIFYAALRKQSTTCKPHQKIICLGDFNVTTSASWYNSSLREQVTIDDLEFNNNGERFHNFFNTQKLSVLNTWFSHKTCRRTTWFSPDGKTKKVYDFILCCSWLRQFVTNCRVYNSFDFDSDHRLVITSLKTPCTKKARKKQKETKTASTTTIDISALNNQETATSYNEKVLQNLSLIDINSNNTVLSQNLTTSLNDAATSTLPPKVKTTLCQPWHDDEKLKHLYETKHKLIKESSQTHLIKSARKKIRLRAKYLVIYISKRKLRKSTN